MLNPEAIFHQHLFLNMKNSQHNDSGSVYPLLESYFREPGRSDGFRNDPDSPEMVHGNEILKKFTRRIHFSKKKVFDITTITSTYESIFLLV